MRISDWSSDVCSSDLTLRRSAFRETEWDTHDSTPLFAVCSKIQPRAGESQRLPISSPCRERVSGFVRLGLAAEDGVERHLAAGDERHRGGDRPGLGIVGEVDHLHRSEEHTSELQSLMRISYAV